MARSKLKISQALWMITAAGLLVAIVSLSGCASGIKVSPASLKASKLFGGKKKDSKPESADVVEKENKESAPRPTEFPIGSIQMVRADEDFVLIRSTRAILLEPGTEMMTYGLEGKPTAKLKLSPERKGSHFVADIVQGNPQKGDRVIAMGVMDSQSKTTQGLVPASGMGSGDIQVLE